MNKQSKQNRKSFKYREHREQTDSCQRGRKLGGGGNKGDWIKKKIRKLIDTDNNMVITRGKGSGGGRRGHRA